MDQVWESADKNEAAGGVKQIGRELLAIDSGHKGDKQKTMGIEVVRRGYE